MVLYLDTNWQSRWQRWNTRRTTKKGPIYKLSAPQLDYNTPSIANEKDSYIFIIPQPKPDYFNLKITYTVEQGKFKEDVTVYKDLRKVLPEDPFGVGGKAYTFHFKLSLDPVDFKVTTDVVSWGPVNDKTMPL